MIHWTSRASDVLETADDRWILLNIMRSLPQNLSCDKDITYTEKGCVSPLYCITFALAIQTECSCRRCAAVATSQGPLSYKSTDGWRSAAGSR